MKKYRRVHADIDLDAVLFNFEQMNKSIPENIANIFIFLISLL